MTYSVVRFHEEGLQILETFGSYDLADHACDKYCDKYPHAWIEVMTTAEAKATP
jgi:hypothetical protein